MSETDLRCRSRFLGADPSIAVAKNWLLLYAADDECVEYVLEHYLEVDILDHLQHVQS